MKNKFSLLVAILPLLLCLSASAQRSFDTFYAPRCLTIAPPTLLTGAASVTNLPTDIRLFNGYVAVVALGVTNGDGSTMTMTLEQNTTTNIAGWSALTTIAIAIPTTLNYTNGGAYGTNQIATNYWLLPGTFTTPTASSAGFASSYLLPVSPTNSGAIAFPSKGAILAGFNADDVQRYVHVIFTTTNAADTNFAGAILYGYTRQDVFNKP